MFTFYSSLLYLYYTTFVAKSNNKFNQSLCILRIEIITQKSYNIITETNKIAERQKDYEVKVMKKMFKVETNASTMFVSYDDEEKIARVLDNEDTNSGMDIREVEDDSSWTVYEDVEDIETFVGINDTPDSSAIIDTITVDF